MLMLMVTAMILSTTLGTSCIIAVDAPKVITQSNRPSLVVPVFALVISSSHHLS
jgi:hypothetical protein